MDLEHEALTEQNTDRARPTARERNRVEEYAQPEPRENHARFSSAQARNARRGERVEGNPRKKSKLALEMDPRSYRINMVF